ncbi:MAG: superoxide reductase [Candidatus Thorarchaeota archaeon SMTZ-45]|nr:MAG: superoxide reductase [Candidatus Thorarchaeota archaeon SMTZ1-45]KXH76107.1 MAG: superoxide reductase [Candidatus Thorarchaeota archaeon SMTZ-45]
MSKKWIQSDDWKTEKHVPVIEIMKVEDGKAFVKVSVGKEIAHPNTTAHHIKWMDLFFWPEGDKFPVEIGYATFDHHGESAQGPDTSGIYSEPVTKFVFKTGKPGTLMATAYCNIHGLWKSEAELTL